MCLGVFSRHLGLVLFCGVSPWPLPGLCIDIQAATIGVVCPVAEKTRQGGTLFPENFLFCPLARNLPPKSQEMKRCWFTQICIKTVRLKCCKNVSFPQQNSNQMPRGFGGWEVMTNDSKSIWKNRHLGVTRTPQCGDKGTLSVLPPPAAPLDSTCSLLGPVSSMWPGRVPEAPPSHG